MRGMLMRLAVVVLAFGPIAASGVNAPSVIMATPGNGDGAVERYTMRFSEPMVPLGDPRAAAPVDVACSVTGEGRWIDGQTFVHEFSRALPGGISCTLTLKDDLKSLAGQPVGGQRKFVIDTGGPTVRAVMPQRYDGTVAQDQVFLVATNVAASRQSVATNAYCAVDGIGEKIPVDLLKPEVPGTILNGIGKDDWRVTRFLEEAGVVGGLPEAAAARNKALGTVIALKCRRPLPPGRDMALVWPETIQGSGRAAGRIQRFDYKTVEEFTAKFACSRTNPRAGCNPIEPATVEFSAPIPKAKADAVRITLADGTTLEPQKKKGSEGEDATSEAFVTSVSFKAKTLEAMTGKVTLPADIRDEAGRPLSNAQRFPLDIRFDTAPPLVKFAATFGILEASEGGVLPVTVRNVEPALRHDILKLSGKSLRVEGGDGAIAQWVQRLDKAEENDFREEPQGGKTVTVNHTRDTPLLDGGSGAKAQSLPLPEKGKAFEVVGIPLGKPGFYVVEMASPTLGRALLGRDTPRYVATGALVTNMAVHFKWGRGRSLAWVTALDTGRPVAGAQVQIRDSCTGKRLAHGTTDAAGQLGVPPGLPSPETYSSCSDEGGHALMVSARKGDDFSFTLTSWDKGIEPYDFDMSYGWEEQPRIFHTVFDRTLIRAGETVQMKHFLRRPVSAGFAAQALKGTLELRHRGSDTVFEMPVTLGRDGIGENQWTAPQGAPQGDYDLNVKVSDDTIYTGQSVRVDEYRLPTMRATVAGPKGAQVKPAQVPVDLFVGYLSGGGAAKLPVTLRATFGTSVPTPKGWDGWSFGGTPLAEGVTSLDGDNRDIAPPIPPAELTALTLDGQGIAHSNVAIPKTLTNGATLAVEMDYPDANGEMLTASQRVPLYASAVQLGIKTDGWIMKQDDLRLKLVAIDLDGTPIKRRAVKVALYSREIISARRRLIGGFYAYDNSAKVTKLSAKCSAFTDAQGLASCALDPGVSGEVYAVATTRDDQGNEAIATTSVWLAGDDDWWFGGDNGDRMDVVPEAREYKSGDTARFQVRMPFRSATALVTVEREGVLSSFVTQLSGKDPVVEVKLAGNYAPNVYVSVLAVRGRVAGWRLWLADFARRWHLPFFQDLAAKPTALVDLAKPSFRMGTAKINVGWDARRLAVDVRSDRDKYHVRDVAKVGVKVAGPDGKRPKSAEIAFAAVDEAILQLAPNQSWQLLDAMMGERPLSVLTSTAQMQVVGKRHYGRKAVAAGGGGGGDLSQVNREDFRPVLLWKGRVPLDAQGRAQMSVPLSDALSSFKLVAIASAGADRFGTGSIAIRTTQDLGIYSGVPPLVRSGDYYGATFTLRNGSDKPMRVTAKPTVAPFVGTTPPLTVDIPAGAAANVTWRLKAPANRDKLVWTLDAHSADGKAADRMTATQTIAPAVPLEVWAATLARVGQNTAIPFAPPAGALPGRGSVDIRLSDSLAPPLDGVRAYMLAYPYGCFEQLLSKAVVAGDVGSWNRLAGEIPAYLDKDGLLRYFPEQTLDGSIALTAYALSLTAENGWQIPEANRAKMIAAMRSVVEGRLTRETGGGGDQRLEKLTALAALARNGASDAALLGQIGINPKDMQSSALADWLTALQRTPGANPGWAIQAETELRTRIVYEGSRIDLVDNNAAPWWLMSTGDEVAIRVLGAILGRPGWQDESPRMMVGIALRQRRGHWDSTTANAWSTVLARRFAALYPPGAVTGMTSLNLAGASRSVAWPAGSTVPLVTLPLPTQSAPLVLSQSGGTGPWAQVSLKAAVPLAKPLFAGYRMTKQVEVIQRRVPGKLTRGDVLRIRITVDASAERNWVVVNDPIPGGATIVGDLGGQSAALAEQASGGEGVQPSYVERGQDAWRGYFGWVPRGRFTVEYAVRLNGAGTFQLPPTRVEALYSPDIRAAVPNKSVTVAMK
jgi:alpha-2-macroglobulin